MESPEHNVHAELRQAFGNLPAPGLSEEELLHWLTARVAETMRLRPERLMSLCYTLDLDEASVSRALDPTVAAADPPFRRLAGLLLQRQRLRARTKYEVRVPSLDDDPNAW